MDELQALGIAFVTLNESIDTTTPAGRLQLHILSAISQFERDRIRERVVAGPERARNDGKRLGRPKLAPPVDRLATVVTLSLNDAAVALGVSRSTVKRWRRVQKSSSAAA